MFIETLEFTIPVDLCDVFSCLKQGQRSNLEFPASVNSYGTTQDAIIQVGLKSNKLTFKVEGVSSDASIISKSECKTLKLSIFDVDRSFIPHESYQEEVPNSQTRVLSNPAKRLHNPDTTIRTPSYKIKKISDSRDSVQIHRNNSHSSDSSQSRNTHETHESRLNVKQEPEDPDLIEIEPDPEDVVPKTEIPYMQIDYSSTNPCTQTSQAALDRLSFPQTSRSQSSSSSSFHQNVPHVPDYAEAGPSQQQSADDFSVFQDDSYDNEGNHLDNDGLCYDTSDYFEDIHQSAEFQHLATYQNLQSSSRFESISKDYPCQQCSLVFKNNVTRWHHVNKIHKKLTFVCTCGKVCNFKHYLQVHQKRCPVYQNTLQ